MKIYLSRTSLKKYILDNVMYLNDEYYNITTKEFLGFNYYILRKRKFIKFFEKGARLV